MQFETEIKYEGYSYNLDVKTTQRNREELEHGTINLSVIISMVIDGDEYPADDINIEYTSKTRSYNYTDEFGTTTEAFYNCIIKTLDNTYGYQWGF